MGDCRSIELELEKYDVGVAKDDRGGLLRNPIEVVVVGDMPLLRADSVELPVAEAPPAEYRLDGSDQLELGDESKDMTADFARVSCVHTRDELLTAKASFSLSLFLHPEGPETAETNKSSRDNRRTNTIFTMQASDDRIRDVNGDTGTRRMLFF